MDVYREEPFVSVVIPVFNEERTVGGIVARTRNTLEQVGLAYEILVVDDGSVDRSAEISRARGAKVLSEPHQGKGCALRLGFKRARGDVIITLDADGSHQPEEITLIVRNIVENNVDFVVGSRFFNADAHVQVPNANRVGNKLFTNLVQLLTGVKITDSQSGFRAIRSSTLRKMRLRSRGYEVESEMLIKALKMGARVVEIPIGFEQRTTGRSRLDPLRDGARILYSLIASYLF